MLTFDNEHFITILLFACKQGSRISACGPNLAAKQRGVSSRSVIKSDRCFTKVKLSQIFVLPKPKQSSDLINECSLHVCLAVKFGPEAAISDPCISVYLKSVVNEII